MKQGDVVGLLTVGSKNAPKQELIGDAGTQALIAAKQEGEKGLATFFQKDRNLAGAVLGPDGMPPMPVQFGKGGKPEAGYKLHKEQAYGAE